MTSPSIRNPDRVASDTIRGFLSQILVSAICWLSLSDDADLVIEGNEDIDTQVIKNGVITEAREESIKDLADRISARSAAVYETFAHFMEAFHSHHSNGVRCYLVFTTTATRANQSVSPKESPSVSFDILKEWALHRRGSGATQTTAAIFDAIVTIVDAKIFQPSKAKTKASATEAAQIKSIEDAISYIRKSDLQDEFLSAVEWNFNSDSVDRLQHTLVQMFEKSEGGNSARAQVLSERVLSTLWAAASTSDIQARTFKAATLRQLKHDVAERHEQWLRWEHMSTFTSWVSWEADHYTVATSDPAPDGTLCLAYCITYLPSQTEAMLSRVCRASADDVAIGRVARHAIKAGEIPKAFIISPTFRRRLLDTIRETDIEIYAFLYQNNQLTAQNIELSIERRRRRKDRKCIDIAASDHVSKLLSLADRAMLAERPALVGLMGAVASAIHDWSQKTTLIEAEEEPIWWIHPKMKLLQTADGKQHRQEDAIWHGITQSPGS